MSHYLYDLRSSGSDATMVVSWTTSVAMSTYCILCHVGDSFYMDPIGMANPARKTVTGTIDESMGRIVANLPDGAVEARHMGDPLTRDRLRWLGIGLGDNATFAHDPKENFAELIVDAPAFEVDDEP